MEKEEKTCGHNQFVNVQPLELIGWLSDNLCVLYCEACEESIVSEFSPSL